MKIFLWQRKGKDTVSVIYVLISGISKDDETSLSYPSYVKGQEYTLDMLLSDFQNKNSYKTYTKTKIGDQEYVLLDEDSDLILLHGDQQLSCSHSGDRRIHAG